MLDKIRHFFKSRKTCKWFCFTCKHYKLCEEEMKHGKLG